MSPAMIFGQCRCALGIGWPFPCMRLSLANSGAPRDCCRGSQMRDAETAYHLADVGGRRRTSADVGGRRRTSADVGGRRRAHAGAELYVSTWGPFVSLSFANDAQS